MSPREVIAKAISEAYETRHLKTDIWLETADAVIDALEKMEVTEDMMLMYHSCATPPHDPIGEVLSIWRAMVGAMRDE